nr:hypothetical protein K-LCC10_0431 [Kaumoebavirus]
MAARFANAYLNMIVGGSVAGCVYGTTKGLTIFDNSLTSPGEEFINGRYSMAAINSMIGAGVGLVAGGFFSMASPVLVPSIAWTLWKARKN